MSFIWVWRLMLALATSPTDAPRLGQATQPSLESPVRAVLKEKAYLWYDEERDQVKPVLADPSSWTTWLRKRVESFEKWLDRQFGRMGTSSAHVGWGNLGAALPTLLFLASGVALLVVLWRFWQLHEPETSVLAARGPSVGEAARIAGLAPGVSLEGIDPWAEALRRRAAGDPAGAVIWLFLDQLLSLSRAGLIRLTPGQTARQYAHALDDPPLREGLRATLGVFEDVYYGHRLPEPAALERVWSGVEAFRRRLETIKAG